MKTYSFHLRRNQDFRHPKQVQAKTAKDALLQFSYYLQETASKKDWKIIKHE